MSWWTRLKTWWAPTSAPEPQSAPDLNVVFSQIYEHPDVKRIEHELRNPIVFDQLLHGTLNPALPVGRVYKYLFPSGVRLLIITLPVGALIVRHYGLPYSGVRIESRFELRTTFHPARPLSAQDLAELINPNNVRDNYGSRLNKKARFPLSPIRRFKRAQNNQ